MKVMKSCILALTLLMALPLVAQTLGDQINALKTQLNAAIDKRSELGTQEKALEQKKSDIEFAWAAAQKQEGILKDEITDFTMKANDYTAAVQRHNANQCTEQCTNGRCDGSCGWYTAEKSQLDQRQSALQSEQAQLQTNAGLIDQIKQNVYNDTQTWTVQAKQLLADYNDNEAAIGRLQDQLTQLMAQYNACRGSIPSDCAVSPLLDDKCEKMHAVCGKLFDGNR